MVRATLSTAVHFNALLDSFSTCNVPLFAESEEAQPDPEGASHNHGGEMSDAENDVDWDCERVAAWEDKCEDRNDFIDDDCPKCDIDPFLEEHCEVPLTFAEGPFWVGSKITVWDPAVLGIHVIEGEYAINNNRDQL